MCVHVCSQCVHLLCGVQWCVCVCVGVCGCDYRESLCRAYELQVIIHTYCVSHSVSVVHIISDIRLHCTVIRRGDAISEFDRGVMVT